MTLRFVPAHPDARDEDRGPCPSPIELASWCDGSMIDDRAGAIAIHLAACDACRIAAGAVGALGGSGTANELAARDEDHAGAGVADDEDSLARVVARASSLVSAPAPMRFARAIRSAVAVAASLAAAFAGWHAASYIAGGVSIGSSAEDAAPIVALAPSGAADLASSTAPTDGSTTTATLADASPADSSADPDADDHSDDIASLLTFGLLEESGHEALFDLSNLDSTERSDS